MIMAVDMGNTHIEVGLVDGEKIELSFRLSTDKNRTAEEYATVLHTVLKINGFDSTGIEGAIMSSVVPSLTYVLREAVRMVTGHTALVVGPGMKNGLKICIDDPRELGADMVVDAVGAIAYYGAPIIVVDMGTATTITAISGDNAFMGGAIVPGVRVSLDALAGRASQLPMIGLDSPGKVIGTNTVDCMKSGILYGQASLLDGMIERMRHDMGTEAKVVATGGLAKLVVPYCLNEIILDNELMIRGLKVIYDRNR